MKKVLTLMAAMSAVAGSAMAADYVWKVNTSGNIEADNMGDIAYEANKFTFSVNAGEKVWVKGTGITVTFVDNATPDGPSQTLAGTSMTFDMEGEGQLYTPTAAGKVTVALGTGATIEKIKVVSSNSLLVEQKFKDVQEEINKANQETAQWAGDEFGGFFSAVRAEINAQGAENQAVRALLEQYQKTNEVDAHAQELLDRLDAAITKIQGTVTTAKDKKAIYDKIVADDAAALNAQLAKGKSTPSARQINNNSLDYIYDWENQGSTFTPKIVKTGSKTKWIEAEWAAFESSSNAELETIAKIKDDAKAQLNNFPNTFVEAGFTRAGFQARYADLQQAAKNVVARAIFERDNKENIKKLNEQMGSLEKIAETEKAPFDLSAAPGDFLNYKETVGQLFMLVDDAPENFVNDRRDADKTTLDGIIANQYTPAKNAFDAAYATFVQQAINDLTAKAEATQKNLNETSYKVSAKYVNEPETQKEKEAEFAKIQQDFDAKKAEWVKAANFATDVVASYQKYVAEDENINNEINAQWTSTLSAQKLEVLANNRKEAEELLGKIEAVRKEYNDNVPRIKKWIDADWSDNATDVSLNANLKALFSKAGGVDKMREEVISDTLRYTKDIAETPDIEFNANDNKYRLLQGEKSTYEGNLGTVEQEILAEIKEAVFTANLAAANYLKYVPRDNAYWFVSNAKKSGYNGANLWTGNKKEHMSDHAVTVFQAEFEKIAHKDANGQGAGYIDEADAMIAAGYTDNPAAVDIATQKLADQVDDVQAIYNKVNPAVDALNVQLADYKALYDAIYDQKVEWSLTKAVAADKQAEIDALGGTLNVVDELKNLNLLFDGVKGEGGATADGAYTTLEKDSNPAKASELKADIEKTINEFKEGLYTINHYDVVVKDQNAKTLADNQIKAVEAKLTLAYTTIDGYKEEVKAEATTDLNAAKAVLDAAKATVEAYFAEHKLAANYEEGDNLKQQIAGVADEIDAALEKAEKANKGADLDYNHDGVVNVDDLKAADADFQESGEGATFYQFIDLYLEHLAD